MTSCARHEQFRFHSTDSFEKPCSQAPPRFPSLVVQKRARGELRNEANADPLTVLSSSTIFPHLLVNTRPSHRAAAP